MRNCHVSATLPLSDEGSEIGAVAAALLLGCCLSELGAMEMRLGGRLKMTTFLDEDSLLFFSFSFTFMLFYHGVNTHDISVQVVKTTLENLYIPYQHFMYQLDECSP
ncbi:unnamed protein product [Citrullus colocynthis]|uniref:Uncharacterized protein n=1 Tax=Citrullus colocynthis TaxID=252529 RepID=A0ABP0YQB6_9ROSI